MTYCDIYKEFKKVTNISDEMINDYRPCMEMYGVPFIANAIVVWLKNGDKIIYAKTGDIQIEENIQMKGFKEISLKEAVNLLIDEKEQNKVFIRRIAKPNEIMKAVDFTWDFERNDNTSSLFNVTFYKEVNYESNKEAEDEN